MSFGMAIGAFTYGLAGLFPRSAEILNLVIGSVAATQSSDQLGPFIDLCEESGVAYFFFRTALVASS
jgi:hypothetical protein